MTTYRFKDPEFNSSFGTALARSNLAKGPYLEASPPFMKGGKPKDLFLELLGHPVDKGFLDAVKGNRNLYLHQERSVKAVHSNQNVIVSTGTGSGKTESFLLPILLHLYQEYEMGTLAPGVRALILYPMNALANDQRDRLGEISEIIYQSDSSFRFTFGQYIGETPQNIKDHHRGGETRARERRPGELVFREEMRQTPPHILLTNFSMLEYLLLRPDDHPLFSGESARKWKFIVLDEVHQYRGSIGIEMSMLLRRLKQRLFEEGKTSSFTCIGTSATLADGEKGFPAVAEFASTLYGEPFLKENIIEGATQKIQDKSTYTLTAEDYLKIASKIYEEDQLQKTLDDTVGKYNIVPLDEGKPLEIQLGHLLLHDNRSFRIRTLVEGNPTDVQELADVVFDDIPVDERNKALYALIECLSWAKDPQNEEPFGSPRYHFFLRALEGAFISYLPEKKVSIDRSFGSSEGMMFETAVCRECGQAYFVGRLISDGSMQYFKEAVKDPGDSKYQIDYLRPLEKDFEEEMEENHPNEDLDIGYLCPVCGAYGEFTPPDCGHKENIMLRVILEASSDDPRSQDRPFKCQACGASSPNTPIRNVVSGSDAPHSVIATTLHECLPEDRRKLLAFADGRQEAAFFAWYLENTYDGFFQRHLIHVALKKLSDIDTEEISVEDLVSQLMKVSSGYKLFGKNVTITKKKEQCWTWILKEFFETSRRVSLEGVGLLQWNLKLPEDFPVPTELLELPFEFTHEEVLELIRFLLDYSRRQHAVEFSDPSEDLVNWDQFGFGTHQDQIILGKPNRMVSTHSWTGRGNRRQFLKKILVARGMGKDFADRCAERFLNLIWDAILEWDTTCTEDDNDKLFIPSGRDGFRLNLRWYRVKSTEKEKLYKCSLCNQIQPYPLLGYCQKPNCKGIIFQVPSSVLSFNHYRRLYLGGLPSKMRVEEHTAQLNHEKARSFQKDFKEGKIHVLSCSTTFELGVDLGTLDNVFLRNVPPESFNYAQRVGRAGRRRGYPGFAITFCKRSPHDLYHFSEPLNIIRGTIKPPVINIVNKKILIRHATALVLSHYFRKYPERFKNVEALFGLDLLEPKTVEELVKHVKNNLAELHSSLARIIPKGYTEDMGIDENDTWIDYVCGGSSRIAEAEKIFQSDYKETWEFEKKSSSKGNYDAAKWAKRMLATMKSEDTLSFLSKTTVIPKYGFPVDVVDLDTRGARGVSAGQEIQLQRDLSIAISEFAPTSSVIANKKEWKSYGLKKVASKEWEKRYYKRCPEHNCFVQWREGQPEPELECGCDWEKKTYIIPSFGFVVSSKEIIKEPKVRPGRMFSTKPYFAGALPDSLNKPDIHLFTETDPLIKLKPAQPGLMAVLCEGKKENAFYICEKCGYGTTKLPSDPSHTNARGEKCNGKLSVYSLGHEFITDVLELRLLLPASPGTHILSLGMSLAYAIAEGAAQALGIPSNDLNTAIGEIPSVTREVPPILLYDAVPGGAGIVSSLEKPEIIVDTLRFALKRVSGSCGCDPDTSCYGCLRSYKNQFAHHFLKRGLAKEYLERLLVLIDEF
jgi:superfamily II DNA/RNA helicase